MAESIPLLDDLPKEADETTSPSNDGDSKISDGYGSVNAPDEVANSDDAKKGTALNTSEASELIRYTIHQKMILHTLAALHFKSRNFWFFIVPKNLLIATSGILAFFLPDYTNVIGSIAILVTFLEGLNESRAYGTRGEMHEAASVDLRGIENDLYMLSTQNLYKERSKSEEENPETFESIRAKFEQSLSGCKSPVPFALISAFEKTLSDENWTETKLRAAIKAEIYYVSGMQSLGQLTNRVDTLAAEIQSYFLFPLFLPNSNRISERAQNVINQKWNKAIEELERARAAALPGSSFRRTGPSEPLVNHSEEEPNSCHGDQC